MALTRAEIARNYRLRHGEEYIEYRRRWQRAWREKNRAKVNARAKLDREKYNAQYISFIDSVKTVCKICGNTDKRVLTFHHRNREEKLFNIADTTGRRCMLEKLKAEVAKCDVLCANCHMILEDEIRNGKGL